jgi:hypothetical protein
VLLAKPGDLRVRVDGAELTVPAGAGIERVVELGTREVGTVNVEADAAGGVVAVWLVPRAEELPPPPPEP